MAWSTLLRLWKPQIRPFALLIRASTRYKFIAPNSFVIAKQGIHWLHFEPAQRRRTDVQPKNIERRRCKFPIFLFQRRLCFNTSEPLCSRQTVQTAPVQTNDQTSLTCVQIHDQSPASYGISTWWGYYEIIPQGAPLPHEKTEIFESTLDYFDHETFTVFYRHSARDAPSNIAKVELSGLRVAKKGITKVKVMLRVEKDLVGFFAVEDIFTKSKKSITFDAETAFRALNSHNIVTSNK